VPAGNPARGVDLALGVSVRGRGRSKRFVKKFPAKVWISKALLAQRFATALIKKGQHADIHLGGRLGRPFFIPNIVCQDFFNDR
jgi:hypothetical protein